MRLKKLFLIMTSSRRREPPHDIHPEKVISRVKFDVNTTGSFGGVKTDRLNCALFVRYFGNYVKVRSPIHIQS